MGASYRPDNPFAPHAAAAESAAAQRYRPDNPFAPKAAAPGHDTFSDQAAGFTRSVGQGVSFGFGDEIEAGLRAPFSDQTYSQIRDAVRTRQHEYEHNHPIASTTGEILGGLATAAIPVAGEANAARVATTAGRVARAAKIGAGTGALYGLGKGEGDVKSQAKSVVGGTIGGAVLGGVTHAALEGGASVLRRATQGAGSRALGDLASDVQRSGRTIPEIRAAASQPDMTFADALGRPGQRGVGWAVSVPNANEADAAAHYMNRGAGRSGRLQQGLETSLGTSRGNVVTDAEALTAATNAHAKTNYDIARATPPVDDAGILNEIHSDDALREAHSVARRVMARATGEPQPPLTRTVKTKILNAQGEPITQDRTEFVPQPLATLDLMKRTLNDVIGKKLDGTSSVGHYEGAGVAKRLGELLDEIDAIRPEYKTARAQFGTDRATEKALQAGQSGLRQLPEQVAHDLPGMAPEAQQRFRQGLAQDVHRDITGRDPTGGRALRSFNAPETQNLFGAAALSPQQQQALLSLIERENTMAGTEHEVFRGSDTARRLQEAAARGSGNPLEGTPVRAGAALASGHPVRALSIVAGRVTERARQAINGEKAAELLRLYLAGRNGPAEVDDVLARFAQYQAGLAPGAMTRALPGATGRAAGYVSGRTANAR